MFGHKCGPNCGQSVFVCGRTPSFGGPGGGSGRPFSFKERCVWVGAGLDLGAFIFDFSLALSAVGVWANQKALPLCPGRRPSQFGTVFWTVQRGTCQVWPKTGPGKSPPGITGRVGRPRVLLPKGYSRRAVLSEHQAHITQLCLKAFFILLLVPVLPGGPPFPMGNRGCWSVSAPTHWGITIFVIFLLALVAAGIRVPGILYLMAIMYTVSLG